MEFHDKRRQLTSSVRRVKWVPVTAAVVLWLASLPVIATAGSAPEDADSGLAHVFTAPGAAGAMESSDGAFGVEVLIREFDPDSTAAESVVANIGGIVGDQVDSVGGFMATVPPSELATLITADSIMSLSVGPRAP